MRVVLRTVRAFRVPGRPRYRQAVLDAGRLTIGRGADQLIQIPDAQLADQHAVIERRGRELTLRVLAAHPVKVNGQERRAAVLARGDVLSLGAGRLRIEDVRGDGVVVMRLDLPSGGAAAAPVAHAQSLKAAGLRAAPASWALVLCVLALTLLFPLLTSWDTPVRASMRDAGIIPNDALWQPGPMHSSHQSIGGNCNACHDKPFDRVADRACGVCHAGTQHHVPARSEARSRFAGMRCADCHVEHAVPSRLIDAGSRPCVACHADIRTLDPRTALHDVSDFGDGHPDFSLAMLEPEGRGPDAVWRTRVLPAAQRGAAEEHSNLKFSHQVHMDRHGIKSPGGDQVLKCADCHQADAGGRNMLPVRMEQHCSRCHSLQFDENDPTTAVPHGRLQPVFTALEEHFSRMFLRGAASAEGTRRRPGGEQAVMSRDEQRRALEWTSRESLRAARELLEKRVCVECHTVSHQPGAAGFEQWRIEPVKLASSWMPLAQFDHAAHRSSDCVACHDGADRSRNSSDVLMPGIRQCRSCHGGSHDTERIASDCTLCHRLHVPGRGDWLAEPARQAASLNGGTAGVQGP